MVVVQNRILSASESNGSTTGSTCSSSRSTFISVSTPRLSPISDMSKLPVVWVNGGTFSTWIRKLSSTSSTLALWAVDCWFSPCSSKVVRFLNRVSGAGFQNRCLGFFGLLDRDGWSSTTMGSSWVPVSSIIGSSGVPWLAKRVSDGDGLGAEKLNCGILNSLSISAKSALVRVSWVWLVHLRGFSVFTFGVGPVYVFSPDANEYGVFVRELGSNSGSNTGLVRVYLL
ncbi:hypothetical protein OGAPHI_001186 [Ogataea philodendri]|uniref:Uncharacterized protein n=1 Tax=Ogataea philodendri TaxID=1378263 RepID=A0A9P8TA28_9ASCO|nr:uncharacterized protein OGAPHI_001186 [Ogataea philodendri]KAH3670671.1 hypothetical protein OGAPHI_001186 [Ogataea philodendri]